MQPYIKFGLGIIIFLLAGYIILHYLADLFLPFVIALVLAYLIEPIVQLLAKKSKINRDLAVGITLLTVISIMAIVIVFAIIKLYAEIVSLSSILPQYYNKVRLDITSLLTRWEDFYLQLPNPVIEVIQNNLSKLYTALETVLRTLITPLAALPSLITILIISAVATYFISRDKEIINKFCWNILPKPWQEKTRTAKNEVVLAVVAFIRAQATLVSVTTVIATIGLSIIGIDYALIIGVLTGLLDFLPILGPSTIFIPWIFYNFLVAPNYSLAIYLSIVYLAIMIIRQIIEPKIVGDAIGLHPLASLMAMYIGIKILGVTGFIIGPLSLVTLKAVIRAGLIPRCPYHKD